MNSPYFIICPELRVYNDVGFKNGNINEFTEPSISLCECKAYKNERSCRFRGCCIIAKEKNTWERINSKSWIKENEK